MYFGCPVWTVKFYPPYDDAIQKIAKLGLKGVELVGWNAKAYEEYYTPETIRHLRKLIEEEGLTLTNFNYSPQYLCSEDAAVRKREENTYKRAVETARELGSPFLTSVSPYPFSVYESVKPLKQIGFSQTWTVNADMNRDWEGNYALYCEQVSKCCETAAEAGLKVLLEAHPYRWVNSASSMKLLQMHVKAENLGFNLDPSHLFASGEMPQCAIYQLKDCLSHAHLSDNDTYTNAHWRPGMGKVDWPAVLKALKDIGYDEVLSLELEDVPGAASKETPLGTDEIDEEIRLAVEYLSRIAVENGITMN